MAPASELDFVIGDTPLGDQLGELPDRRQAVELVHGCDDLVGTTGGAGWPGRE